MALVDEFRRLLPGAKYLKEIPFAVEGDGPTGYRDAGILEEDAARSGETSHLVAANPPETGGGLEIPPGALLKKLHVQLLTQEARVASFGRRAQLLDGLVAEHALDEQQLRAATVDQLDVSLEDGQPIAAVKGHRPLPENQGLGRKILVFGAEGG